MLKVITIMSMVSIAGNAVAFGLKVPKLPGAESNDTAAQAIDIMGGQKDIVASYVRTMTNITTAQVSLLTAFGLNDEANALQAEADLLKGDCNTDCLEKVTDVSNSANEAIVEKAEKKEELSAEGEAKYSESLKPYGLGTVEGVSLLPKTSSWASATLDKIKSDPMNALSMKKDAAVGLFISKALPSMLTSWKDTTGKLMTYGKEKKLDMSGANDWDFSE